MTATFADVGGMVNFVKLEMKRRVLNDDCPFVTLWPVLKEEDLAVAHSPIVSALALARQMNPASAQQCERRIDSLPTNEESRGERPVERCNHRKLDLWCQKRSWPSAAKRHTPQYCGGADPCIA